MTGEYYFGSSFNAKRDWYWGSGRRIREQIAQYGKDNFVKEILGEFDDRVEAHKKENQYIEKFIHDDKCLNQMFNRHFGSFNEETCTKRSASNLGKHRTDDTRAKLSAANRGENNPMYGKTLSKEHRAKLSAANRGKIVSDDTRAKLSAANRGKHLSDDTRAKIGAAQRGKIVSDDTRAKLSASNLGKLRGKHWRKNPVTGKREYYD